MAVLNLERPIKRGMIRGRKSRNQTLTTKVTETEQRAVEEAASADEKTTGEWLRDLTLRTLRCGARLAGGYDKARCALYRTSRILIGTCPASTSRC